MKTVQELCDQGIEALLALYGECDGLEPNCIACQATLLIRDMRALRAEETAEPKARRTER